MSRTMSRKVNSDLIKENYISGYMKSGSIENLGIQSMPKS